MWEMGLSQRVYLGFRPARFEDLMCVNLKGFVLAVDQLGLKMSQ